MGCAWAPEEASFEVDVRCGWERLEWLGAKEVAEEAGQAMAEPARLHLTRQNAAGWAETHEARAIRTSRDTSHTFADPLLQSENSKTFVLYKRAFPEARWRG